MPIWLLLPTILTALAVFAIVQDRRKLAVTRVRFGHPHKLDLMEMVIPILLVSLLTFGLPALSVWLATNIDC